MALTEHTVRADVAELLHLEPEELDDDADLFAEGLDSVRLIGLVERWRATGVEVTFVELAARPTLAGWWALLSPRVG